MEKVQNSVDDVIAHAQSMQELISRLTRVFESRKLVAYISKTLTEVERRYPQMQREALAIVWVFIL